MPPAGPISFVGVDLAWSPARPTGVAIARGDEHGARLVAWRSDAEGYREVVELIRSHAGGSPAVVAVDAPLVVPNQDSIRPCDRGVNADFRPFRAGVYPANRALLRRYGGFEGERLRGALLADDYVDAVPLRARDKRQALFETYPHAVMVALFRLSRRLPYKARGRRRSWPVREEAYREYRSHLAGLSEAEPRLEVPPSLLEGELEGLSEKERKSYEDLLDGVLCAYMAQYAWYWGPQRCRLYGSVKEGYMILPRLEGSAG